jgi:cell division transport system permease protein
VQATTGAANDIRGKLLLDVYLKPSATPSDATRVHDLIQSRIPNVKSVTYISKQQAYQQQVKRNPEAYRLLGSNPLPDTLRIVPRDPGQIEQISNALEPKGPSGTRNPVDSAIDQVKNRRDETAKILSATRVVKLSMALLAVLLIAASILLIANTIRLSLFARRREVEVMRLVGATNWFIRWPFVIEGIIVGALGGVLAILLLAVGKIALIDPLASDFALVAAPKTVSFAVLIAVLLAASVGVSAAGSGLSLRRFLRV